MVEGKAQGNHSGVRAEKRQKGFPPRLPAAGLLTVKQCDSCVTSGGATQIPYEDLVNLEYISQCATRTFKD